MSQAPLFDLTEKQKEFIACGDDEVLYGGPLHDKTLVITDQGRKAIEQIRVGDRVLTPKGEFTEVVDIPFIGIEESYRLTFSNGAQVIASAGHKWSVGTADWSKTGQPYRTKRTHELLDFKMGRGRNRYRMPSVAAYEMPEREHFISPYAMGVLLANGCFTKGLNIFTPDKEVVDRVQSELDPSYELVFRAGVAYGLVKRSRCKTEPNDYKEELKRLNLFGETSHTKFIPHEYLRDSIQNRIDLLRGLMDSDGTCRDVADGRDGAEAKYTTVSSRLRDDFIALAESLGMGATYHSELLITGSTAYRIALSGGQINPFHLSRKAKRYEAFTVRQNKVMITNIEPVGLQPVRCITVADPDALFVLNRNIVTHNSAGGGKTVALSIKALGLNNIGITHPEYRGLIIRRSFEDLDTVLKYQSRVYRETSRPQAEWKTGDNEWVWPNGAKISMGYLSTKSDLPRYTGNEYSFIGVEELPDTIPELSWWQLLVSRTRTDIEGLKPQTVATANPKGKGFAWMQAHFAVAPDGKSTFQELWTERLEIDGIVIEPQRTTRRYIQSLITDNTLWPTEQRAAYMAKLAQMNEQDRNALLFGRWDYAAADDLLIHPAFVAKAYEQILIPERLKVGRRIIGCDPAHQGKDTTVLIHRKLQTCFRLQRWARLDSMQLAHKLKTEIDRASDEDGVPPVVNLDYAHGTGPGERLREMGYQINIVNFASKSLEPEKYKNKRAEMYGEMAEAIQTAEHYRIPPDAALKAQLSAILIERDSNGLLKLQAKDVIKKTVGRSPDEADALALTYAWPYVPTVAQMAGHAQGHVVERW